MRKMISTAAKALCILAIMFSLSSADCFAVNKGGDKGGNGGSGSGGTSGNRDNNGNTIPPIIILPPPR